MSGEDELMTFSDDDNELLTFSDENEPLSFLKDEVDPIHIDQTWKILIVDDEPEIHKITQMVLKDYSFENKKFEFLNAYSRSEALQVLTENGDVALILLDVVMESDDAGLECVKDIREKLGNHDVRIILRTGQPGQAPEEKVIIEYDINDYKAKTELTSEKLFTVVISSLRTYRYIQMLNHSRNGLETIIKSTKNLFEQNIFSVFAAGILEQLISLLKLDESSLYLNISSISAFQDIKDGDYSIVAATGDFAEEVNRPLKKSIPKDVLNKIDDAVRNQKSIFSENSYIGYLETQKGEHTLLYLQWQRQLSDIDMKLISIFSSNVAIAFENISLNRDIIATQKEVIFTLAELVEGRSKETANHIKRVAAICCLIAEKMGLEDHHIDMLRLSAPMHDIGKIATPDSILNKPGKLTVDEYEIMKEHSALGYSVFKNSDKKMMQAAAIIANEHHEKWNGKGYPNGISGEDIHIYGRITALADVVDALTNKRCYKEPWEMERVIALLKEERGEHFDPKVVDAFLSSLEEYKEIQKNYP